MSSSYHPGPVEMDSNLQQHVQPDQNLDQMSLINLLNLDSSDPSSIAHFNNLHAFPLQLPSSIGVLDYNNHLQPVSSLDPNPLPTQNDNLAFFNSNNNLEYSLELDNPPHIPPETPSSCAPPSSPSWSPLDQLLFPPLAQHPQSSPLFPFDLVPNWQDSTGDPNREPELNLIDFSNVLDSQLEDWSLIFDSIQPTQESNNYELAQFFHPSGSKDGEPYQQPTLPGLQLGSVRPTTECLEEFNRSNVESGAVENSFYPINSDVTDFASPISTNSYNHALSMKRKRSTNSPVVEPEPFPFDPFGMRFMQSSIGQQEESNKENMNSEPMENKTKNKRPKTSSSRSTSKSKIHVCTECGKSFPRLTSLTQHKLTHNGERPFRCSFEGCTKSFTTSSNSKRHWRTHF